MRVAFFGGTAGLCLVWRADETQTGNRNFLLALALILVALGVVMVGQSAIGDRHCLATRSRALPVWTMRQPCSRPVLPQKGNRRADENAEVGFPYVGSGA
jgi:hypothetical protein